MRFSKKCTRHVNIFIMLYIAYIQYGQVKAGYLENTYSEGVIEDASLDTAELIVKNNYPVETHYVKTDDGYILRVHRIPKPGAKPVFMMHGLLDTSATWILMGADKALGYYLADNDYDVWMGNSRGNRYSRNHTSLNPDEDILFWSFSWHEIGFNDLPAMIDYVLKETGYKKVGYFGHSQGTTAFWVLCSMHPEYNDKITMMQALAPVAFMKNVKAPLLGIAKNFVAANGDKVYELLPRTNVLWRSCFASKFSQDTCMKIVNNIVGKDEEQMNMALLPTIFGHIPAGCNLKQVIHYLQLIDNGRFCQFDYGEEGNMKHYGHDIAPDYPLEKITAPVGLYYTSNDYLSSEIDVEHLAKLLPNVVENTLYPYKEWNHLTVSWGIDARELAHKRMLTLLKNYNYE